MQTSRPSAEAPPHGPHDLAQVHEHQIHERRSTLLVGVLLIVVALFVAVSIVSAYR